MLLRCLQNVGDPCTWKEEKNIWKDVSKERGEQFGTDKLSVYVTTAMKMQVAAAIAGSDEILPRKQISVGWFDGMIFIYNF